jgi:hypothetical protein
MKLLVDDGNDDELYTGMAFSQLKKRLWYSK